MRRSGGIGEKENENGKKWDVLEYWKRKVGRNGARWNRDKEEVRENGMCWRKRKVKMGRSAGIGVKKMEKER